MGYFLLELPVIGMDTDDIRVTWSHLDTFSAGNDVSGTDMMMIVRSDICLSSF